MPYYINKVWADCFVRKSENFYIFSKIIAEKFGG